MLSPDYVRLTGLLVIVFRLYAPRRSVDVSSAVRTQARCGRDLGPAR